MKARSLLLGTVSVVLVACADDAGMEVDVEADAAPRPEVDAAPPAADAAVTSGRCVVERPGLPVTVIFHDADGHQLAAVETDAKGVAVFDGCVAGGMVTLVNPGPPAAVGVRKLVTVQGVSPGDVVRFDPLPAEGLPEGPLSLLVENSVDKVTSGATTYVATLGDCTAAPQPLLAATGGTIQAPSLQACLGDDPTDLVAVSIAEDAMGNPLGFARSTTTDLTTPSLATGGAWVAWNGLTKVTITNAPAGATGGFRTVAPYIDGVRYDLQYGPAPLAGGDLMLAYWPEAIADEHRIGLSYAFTAEETASLALMRTAARPAVLDAGQLLLARPKSMVADVSEPGRPKVLWQAGDDRADLSRAELRFTDTAGQGVWIVIGPGNPRELRVPVLDAPFDALAPGADAVIALSQFYLIDRETTYATHLDEGQSTLASAETSLLPTVREVSGTTLRYVGYERKD